MSKDNAFLVNALERLIVALDKVQRTLDRVFPIVRIPRRDQPRDDGPAVYSYGCRPYEDGDGVAVYYGCRPSTAPRGISSDRIAVTTTSSPLEPGEWYVTEPCGTDVLKRG